jgi:hypothetical protein
MTGAEIAQLIIIFGPQAIALIQKLVEVWNKELTPDEVKAICAVAQTTYDQYIAQARSAAPLAIAG